MEITKHAKQRLRQRGNVNKKSIPRVVRLALEKGIKHSETRGKLRTYLDGKYLKKCSANNMRIYNNQIFIFHNEHLITVLDLPSKYNKYVKDIMKRRKL